MSQGSSARDASRWARSVASKASAAPWRAAIIASAMRPLVSLAAGFSCMSRTITTCFAASASSPFSSAMVSNVPCIRRTAVTSWMSKFARSDRMSFSMASASASTAAGSLTMTLGLAGSV